MLLTQAHLYKALINPDFKRNIPSSNSFIALISFSEEECQKLNWKQRTDEEKEEKVFLEPFNVVKSYLKKYIEPLLNQSN